MMCLLGNSSVFLSDRSASMRRVEPLCADSDDVPVWENRWTLPYMDIPFLFQITCSQVSAVPVKEFSDAYWETA